MSDAAKKLEDQITCVICLDRYKDPRSLSCLHSFCTECLERLPREKEGQDETVSCPTCRNVTKIPQGKITNLVITFRINNLLEVQDLLQKSSGSDRNNCPCGNCPQEEAKFYCQKCDKFICQACNDIHKKWSSLADHQVMGIEEVANQANSNNMVSLKPTPPMECPSHNEPLKVYCIKCDQPICYLCTIKDHKRHDHTLVNDAYEEYKQKIEERVELLEEKVLVKIEEKKEMEENKTIVQEKAKTHKVMINEFCDSFMEKVEQLRRLGLQAVEMGTASYIAAKDQQIEEIEVAIKALNDCKDHVEQSVEKSTPIQLLLITKQMMERFDELVGCPTKVQHAVLQPKGREVPAVFSKDISDQLHTMQQKTMQDYRKNILTTVSLPYPQLVYKQSEIITDLPDTIQISHVPRTATFCYLFKGHSVVINTKYLSCFFESEMRTGYPMRRVADINCDVYYFYDDVIKYQVHFTPTTVGTYIFKVKIGSLITNIKKVVFHNN